MATQIESSIAPSVLVNDVRTWPTSQLFLPTARLGSVRSAPQSHRARSSNGDPRGLASAMIKVAKGEPLPTIICQARPEEDGAESHPIVA